MIDKPRTSFVLMVVVIVISAIAIAFALTISLTVANWTDQPPTAQGHLHSRTVTVMGSEDVLQLARSRAYAPRRGYADAR